jgi:hypothetical protein
MIRETVSLSLGERVGVRAEFIFNRIVPAAPINKIYD